MVNWFCLATPEATPCVAINRLHGDIAKELRPPDVRERLVAQGTDPVGSTPDDFGAFMKTEIAKWARVIKDANIRAH